MTRMRAEWYRRGIEPQWLLDGLMNIQLGDILASICVNTYGFAILDNLRLEQERIEFTLVEAAVEV